MGWEDPTTRNKMRKSVFKVFKMNAMADGSSAIMKKKVIKFRSIKKFIKIGGTYICNS